MSENDNKIEMSNENDPRKFAIKFDGNNNLVKIGKCRVLNAHVSIRVIGSGNTVEIGNDNIFNRGINISIFPGGSGVRADLNRISIGNGNFFNGSKIQVYCCDQANQVSIGNDCLFAGNINLNTSDNHQIFNIDTGEIENPPGDINIGDHVWICEDVGFLPSSGIGDNSIVGTRALVTKHFEEENILIGGVPAKVLKRRVNWRR